MDRIGLTIAFILQTAWVFFIGLQIALTALWALPTADRTKGSIAANAVLTAGALFLALLSYAEHTRSVKPSLIINAYLLLSIIFDIARVRTLWLRSINSFNDGIAIVTTVALGAKVVLAFLEAIEKRSILRHEFAGYPPEATAGLYNKATFWWLNPLFKNGFSNTLSVEDLSVLDKELSSERLLALFEERWSKGDHQSKIFFWISTNLLVFQSNQSRPIPCNPRPSRQPNILFWQRSPLGPASWLSTSASLFF